MKLWRETIELRKVRGLVRPMLEKDSGMWLARLVRDFVVRRARTGIA